MSTVMVSPDPEDPPDDEASSDPEPQPVTASATTAQEARAQPARVVRLRGMEFMARTSLMAG
jgi:hypothetical protein